MLRPVSRIEQQLCCRAWGLVRPRVQKKLTHGSPQAGSARFARLDQRTACGHQPTGGQPLGQMLELRRFAAAIDPLKNDEASPHAARSIRAFTTTVIELRAISSAAKGGESSTPWAGRSAPAAIGRAIRL